MTIWVYYILNLIIFIDETLLNSIRKFKTMKLLQQLVA